MESASSPNATAFIQLQKPIAHCLQTSLSRSTSKLRSEWKDNVLTNRVPSSRLQSRQESCFSKRETLTRGSYVSRENSRIREVADPQTEESPSFLMRKKDEFKRVTAECFQAGESHQRMSELWSKFGLNGGSKQNDAQKLPRESRGGIESHEIMFPHPKYSVMFDRNVSLSKAPQPLQPNFRSITDRGKFVSADVTPRPSGALEGNDSKPNCKTSRIRNLKSTQNETLDHSPIQVSRDGGSITAPELPIEFYGKQAQQNPSFYSRIKNMHSGSHKKPAGSTLGNLVSILQPKDWSQGSRLVETDTQHRERTDRSSIIHEHLRDSVSFGLSAVQRARNHANGNGTVHFSRSPEPSGLELSTQPPQSTKENRKGSGCVSPGQDLGSKSQEYYPESSAYQSQIRSQNMGYSNLAADRNMDQTDLGAATFSKSSANNTKHHIHARQSSLQRQAPKELMEMVIHLRKGLIGFDLSSLQPGDFIQFDMLRQELEIVLSTANR